MFKNRLHFCWIFLLFVFFSTSSFASVDILYQQPYGNSWANVLSAGETRVTLYEGKFPVHKRGKLRLELLEELRDGGEASTYLWKLLSEDNEVIQESEGDKAIFLIPESETFSVQLVPSAEELETLTWEFVTVKAPWIRIVKPVHDLVVKYRQPVTLVVNSQDYQGFLPEIIWYSVNGKTKKILGAGDEITTRWFDIGYNQVYAVAVDRAGQKSISDSIGVIVPYQKIDLKVLSPKSESQFDWNQPILAYAEGVNIEYSLDGESFRRGSGQVLTGLSAGKHELVFKSGRNLEKVRFTIKEPTDKQVKLNRVSGRVESSSGMNRWNRVESGNKIPYGYSIRTGDDGIAEILLPDGLVYVLNHNKSVKILPDGKLAENLSDDSMMVTSLAGSENTKQMIEQLKPMITTLDKMLEQYDVQSIEVDGDKDLQQLIDRLLKGYIHIEDISIQ